MDAKRVGVSVYKALARDAMHVLNVWMLTNERTRLLSLLATSKKGISCEKWRPEHPTGIVLPLAEPWRWYHKMRTPYYCVECHQRASHCNEYTCSAQNASRVRYRVEQLWLELCDSDEDEDEESEEGEED